MAKDTYRQPTSPDFICRESLELTATLLQLSQPTLAEQLHFILKTRSIPTHQIQRESRQGIIEVFNNFDLLRYLSAESVGKIVHQLTALAQNAISNNPHQLTTLLTHLNQQMPTLSKAQLVSIIAYLINDWSYTIEWILGHSTVAHPTQTSDLSAFH